jgi:uncharacterized membrane protein
MSNWENSSDIESILDKIRINSINLNKSHMKNYFYYKKLGKWFQIPTIILSSFNSVFSVGFTYTSQENISSVSALISLIVSIINSVQLYLKIIENMEQEQEISKKYYTLSSDIYKILQLNKDHRPENANEILDDYYNQYIELLNKSNLLNNNSYSDKLLILPKEKSLFKKFQKITTKNIDDNESSSSSISSDTPRMTTQLKDITVPINEITTPLNNNTTQEKDNTSPLNEIARYDDNDVFEENI